MSHRRELLRFCVRINFVNQKTAIPKDAAAVVLLNAAGDKVLWAQRNPKLAFLGGYHAFAGGKLETTDALVKIENCADAELGKFIACAVREAFEEIGVLLVRNGEKLTRGQRASLHDDLISGRMTFAEILEHWNLWVDAKIFLHWFLDDSAIFARSFQNQIFLALCPPKQEPYAAISELQNVEFIEPDNALERWKKSQVLISPPVLLSLKTLAECLSQRRKDVEEKQKEDKTTEVNLTEQTFVEKIIQKSLRLCVSAVKNF